jgi:hypothetical protein
MLMQQEAKPAVIAIAVVLLVAITAFIGWRTLGSKGDTLPQSTVNAHWQEKKSGPNR